MSMMQNNAQALVKLRGMTRADLETRFDTYAPVQGKIVGALYNADTDGMKNILLKFNPAGVVADSRF